MASERAATPSRGYGRLSAPLPHASTDPWDASTDPWDASTDPWDASTDPWDASTDPWDVVADPWGVVATARPAFSCSDASIFRPLGQLCGCLGHCGRLWPHAFGCWKGATGDEREILADNLWQMAGAAGYKFHPKSEKSLTPRAAERAPGRRKRAADTFSPAFAIGQFFGWPSARFAPGGRGARERPPLWPGRARGARTFFAREARVY